MEIIYFQSNTYGAPQGKCLRYRKVVVDCEEDDLALVENDMVCYKGKWGMLDGDGKLIIPAEYDFIDCICSETQFKVALGDLVIDLCKSQIGGEITYIAKGAKWGIINENNEILVPIQYDWVEELALNNYAVNIGCTLEYNDNYQEEYWFAQNGKWGVVDANHKIIVPIEYDSYYNTAKKYEDLIFVQKGRPYFDEQEPYDVFDYGGNLLYSNIQGFVVRIFGSP
ncbi:hypothetical protein DBR40_16665 [Pedobacter sp. KBW01]|uniref:WG repeat-containing protein n=1 Tax=Pedobacter sp. KBW01 TaxID=2153364 RepID=UPI000F5AEFAE|nr:WG repeat-containing protein [Pedobacter sp. KBW01]RQO71438.1 hypothetical protein DBR40_16665 [Pedobacter sp. KBW01]